VPHSGPVIPPSEDLPPITLPPGNGGGFVTSGPFANMTVNLGPVIPLDGTAPGTLGGLGWNPRGLKRDIGSALITRYANYTTILNLLRAPTLGQYRILLEGVPSTIEIGPHGAGHWTISGDPGADVFTSPGDPAFWVHHGMIDRMWTFWYVKNL
jgi:tyrosinase